MRRIAALIVLAVTGTTAAFAALPSSPQAGPGSYRVDAIFDTAKGVLPGQIVKIAGARVGTIEDVSLTPDYKARIEMSVDRRFAPFRADASCEIQPEALISENFVQCVPGTPDAGELPVDGEAPTVPVERTAVPVNLTDLFQIWRTPVRQRLTLVVDTLGIGLASRGDDINEILRRTNPALSQARTAIETLNGQRRRLTRITDASDHVIGELARHDGRVQELISSGAAVTNRIGSHRTELSAAIEDLPPLLRTARPALERLDRFGADARPVLGDLRASGPGLERLLASIEPAAEAATPALASLERATDRGLEATDTVTPLLPELTSFARDAKPTGAKLADTLDSLRERGFVEGLLNYVYYFSAATARYDSTGHLAPLLLGFGECSAFAREPEEACREEHPNEQDGKRGGGNRKLGGTPEPDQADPAPQAPAAPADPSTPAPDQGPLPGAELPELPLPGVGGNGNGAGKPPSDEALDGLLDFLLKP